MRTLHVGLRVADLERSLAFYGALGYQVVGRVPGTRFGDLTMLKLPDDPFVALELVAGEPGDGAGTLHHLVVHVEAMDAFLARLAEAGIEPDEPPSSPEEGFHLAWITDPDGNRIELVQWPPGHPPGMTAGDFPDA